MKNLVSKMLLGLGLLLLVPACSSTKSTVDPLEEHPNVVVEYYYPATRQLPPAPVYSRLTWSHLPQPIPRSQASESVPLLMPQMEFTLLNSTFAEAAEALAEALGYRWDCPKKYRSRRVSIAMTGTVEDFVKEFQKQTGEILDLDHEERLVRVIAKETLPKLPSGSRAPGDYPPAKGS